MKSLLSLLARYALTLSAAAAASLLAFMMWKHYAQTPWTRDGRVRADVVQIAPDVSGPVISVAVRDNQWVNRGDVLYTIDPRWLKLAVVSAQADVESKRHEMLMRQDAAHRRTLIKNAISSEDLQQTGSAANVAAANYHGALAALDLAELNLAHATVHIRVGDAAQVMLMGYEPVITGHVESIGHGIGDSNDEAGGLGLPDVEPTFSWVRLAQRVPVRIHIDRLPEGVELVAGLSASVAVGR
ncbi:MAG: biotin/lipoyl-binding protein [Enterobacter sp.]|nr:biotin/lipoyl-binding protein [Enterobacter sp.]